MSECKKIANARTSGRRVPPYVARMCAGQKKKGMDGEWYVSVKRKGGVYVWKKAYDDVQEKFRGCIAHPSEGGMSIANVRRAAFRLRLDPSGRKEEVCTRLAEDDRFTPGVMPPARKTSSKPSLAKYDVRDGILRQNGRAIRRPIKIVETPEYDVYWKKSLGYTLEKINELCRGKLNARYVKSRDRDKDSYGFVLRDSKGISQAMLVAGPTKKDNVIEVYVVCSNPGYGQKLINAFEDYERSNGKRKKKSTGSRKKKSSGSAKKTIVLCGNKHASGFYRGIGYKPIDSRRECLNLGITNYCPDNFDEKCLYMYKNL